MTDALEAFGRERLSTHYFMRDFLYSEIAAVHGIPNVPDCPELAIPDCCRNRKVRYYPDQAGSRFREKSVIPAKAGIQGFS